MSRVKVIPKRAKSEKFDAQPPPPEQPPPEQPTPEQPTPEQPNEVSKEKAIKNVVAKIKRVEIQLKKYNTKLADLQEELKREKTRE